ncbi:hypothetical protein CW745_05120 [Psychromonas sp. psych-6C06]|uniref:ABC-three component system middle component 6 n=1 Tax=Psychromonas sp. psych-6C06 TaxID=2058089 RepID=UPI000C3323AB|nr:ABC-three component system middle component 6 [Psychromonas sp. psych-6C06]PKF62804.1 hypothetical protein CW745_05120 [Psychromonas sp. psych-6C06]
MLKPHRFMNLDYSLVHVASQVLQCLKERGNKQLHEVLSYAKTSCEEINEQDVMLAISFLYLLGKVEYKNETDLVCICEINND